MKGWSLTNVSWSKSDLRSYAMFPMHVYSNEDAAIADAYAVMHRLQGIEKGVIVTEAGDWTLRFSAKYCLEPDQDIEYSMIVSPIEIYDRPVEKDS